MLEEVIVESSKYLLVKSTSKNYSPSLHGIYKIIMFKNQSFLFWGVSTPKGPKEF
jgi:hypothetical protein